MKLISFTIIGKSEHLWIRFSYEIYLLKSMIFKNFSQELPLSEL